MRRLAVHSGRLIALLLTAGVFLLWPAPAASAHPLGNFTINHYNGLVLSPTGVVDHAVVDTAEIPTLSAKDDVDANGDGEADAAERATYAATECARLGDDLQLRAGGRDVGWRVAASSFVYRPGQAGLKVSRLECELRADLDLSSPTDVAFEDDFYAQRIGWREITAVGDGLDLGERDVATTSISDELRSYPNDLLSSPLDQRSVDLHVQPGEDSGGGALPEVEGAGPVTRAINGLTTRLDTLVGGHLTWGVGVAAVLLSLLLGASHAALPGHGKTLMAAYMVGTRGSPRDAVLIGATVTLAHTSGVLLLGLLFSVGTSWAGETVLAILGVISGLLVASIGVALVRSALRRRSAQVDELWGHGHGHGTDGTAMDAWARSRPWTRSRRMTPSTLTSPSRSAPSCSTRSRQSRR